MFKKINNGEYELYNESGDTMIATLTKCESATKSYWWIESWLNVKAEGRSRSDAIENLANKSNEFYALLIS